MSRLPPRVQGDLGEASALAYYVEQGACVFVPFNSSPDVDLVADFGDRLVRVQVKTSGSWTPSQRWSVAICTRGGNQSWSGMTKRFGAARCDELFVLVGDGRRWRIPAGVVEATTSICLGGPKYAAYEVNPGRAFQTSAEVASLGSPTPAG